MSRINLWNISRKTLLFNTVPICRHSNKATENIEGKKGIDVSKKPSKRMEDFKKKLRETTPIDDLGEQQLHPSQKDNPLPPFPNNTNPETGEVGGPRGPEPTRFGDWERKGRVSDF